MTQRMGTVPWFAITGPLSLFVDSFASVIILALL